MFELDNCLFLQKKVLPATLWLESQRTRSKNLVLVTPAQQCTGASFSCSITLAPQCQFTLRSFATPVSLNQEPFSSPEGDHISCDNVVAGVASEKNLPQKLRTEELKSVLLDSERSKLLKKLSEANQFNRFLKRQLQTKDEFLVNLKNELAILELEFESLVNLVEEIASYGVQPGSRKINGKYIQSHLISHLQAVREKVKKNIKEIHSLRLEEVTLLWIGMAESVQIMGSFDGWTQGEEMSCEYSGDYARFTCTLKLRPGRYEIKFLVDGEWKLSPQLATVGEGELKNNLLVVE